MDPEVTKEEKLEYNQIKIKNLKTEKETLYTIKEITWVRDMAMSNQYVNADKTQNHQELWIARLHEATGLTDTELRNMDRRTFETLVHKWIEINDVDGLSFLGIKKPDLKE